MIFKSFFFNFESCKGNIEFVYMTEKCVILLHFVKYFSSFPCTCKFAKAYSEELYWYTCNVQYLLKCYFLNIFISSTDRYAVVQNKSIYISNRFLKKYLSIIFWQAFAHWEIRGYTYFRDWSKNKRVLKTSFPDVNLTFLREKNRINHEIVK